MATRIECEYLLDGNFGGISVFHFETGGTVTELEQWAGIFVDLVTPWMPATAEVAFKNEWTTHDDGTGELTAAGSMDGPSGPGTATGTEIVPQNAAIQLKWSTSGVVDGHRVAGRTFVPFVSNEFNDNGQPSGLPVSDAVVSRGFSIWARPLKDKDGNVIRPGSVHAVTERDIRSEFGTMGSRRRA